MSGFTKLFSSITRSTIWGEDDATVKIWVTMMALADRDGIVEASVPGLAHEARKTIAEVEAALKKFMAPDAYSRTKEHEGRRIEEVRGGWRLLNHGYYRELNDAEDRREKAAARQRRSRERRSGDAQQTIDVTSERDSDVTERDGHAESQPSRDVRHADQIRSETEADQIQIRVRREREAERLRLPPTRGTFNALQLEVANRVWDAQNQLRREVIRGARDLRATKGSLDLICKLFVLGHTEEECIAVLNSVAARVKLDASQAQWFNGETTWRPPNFRRELGSVGARSASTLPANGRKNGFDHVLDSIADQRRARGES